MMRKIGITLAALGSELREAPAKARSLGFDGILIEAAVSGIDLTTLSSTGRREVRHLFAAQGRELIGLNVRLGKAGLTPSADLDAAIDRLERVFHTAAELQARLVCVDLGPLPEPQRTAKPKPPVNPQAAGLIIIPEPPPPEPEVQTPPPDPAMVASVDGALVEIGARADRYSVAVAMKSDLASFAALERALGAARCPWFGVDFDPAAALADRWSMDETLSTLGPLIRHVRGRDGVRGTDHRVRPVVVAGDVGWEALLADLDAAAYAGWITIDPQELTDRLAAAVAGRDLVRGKQSG
jgi:sugar phosphate isomerase/epimerase